MKHAQPQRILLALALLACIQCAHAAEKPDILFIAIDDMNSWTTLFDQDNPIQTPNLKRLAERGTFFNRAYCNAPICNPSRTSILLGKEPYHTGVYHNKDDWQKLQPNATTLPRYFLNHGYATRSAGKIYHHGRHSTRDKQALGCEEFVGHNRSRRVLSNLNGYEGQTALATFSFDWGIYPDRDNMGDLRTVKKIQEYYANAPEDRPLFVAAGIFRPHLPFYAPADTFEQYPEEKLVMPKYSLDEKDLEDIPLPGVAMTMEQQFIYNHVMTAPRDSVGGIRHKVRSYQAAASFADEMVGKLLDILDASGRADNTIIVLWSDHGYHLGDKGICVKFTLWEKGTHVPLIVVAPGVGKPGQVCQRPVNLMDIYPTLVELAGLPRKGDLDGNSLVPLLKNTSLEWRPAITTMYRGNHAVRNDRFRYIRYFDGSEELYDHGMPGQSDPDPWEEDNLADNPEYDDVKQQLAARMPKLEEQARGMHESPLPQRMQTIQRCGGKRPSPARDRQ